MWHCDKSQKLISEFWANVSSSDRDKYLVSGIYHEECQQLLLSINHICDIEICNGAQCLNNCIAWTNSLISHVLTAGTDLKRNIMLNEEHLCMVIYLTIDTANLMWHDIYMLAISFGWYPLLRNNCDVVIKVRN